MKLLKLILSVFFLCTTTVFSQQTSDSANAYYIINKAIEALGGKEYLQTIKTMYSEGSTKVKGRPVRWIVKEMLPNKGAFQIVYNNRTVFQNWFDGRRGFEIVDGEKKRTDENEFKDKEFKKNIFNEFDYLDSSLWKLELDGEEMVLNERCYKIKATLTNGLMKILYYSKNSFYRLREDKTTSQGTNNFSSVLFSNYKKFGELTHYSVMKIQNSNEGQIINVDTIMLNEMVTENDFK